MKSFHSGVICPQNPKLWGVKQVPHKEQATGYTTEIFFIPRCSLKTRQFPISGRRTVAKLRGFKVDQFSDFGLFSPCKSRKKYLPVTSLQPRSYIAAGSGVFLRLLVGELGTSKVCLWQMAILQNVTARCVRCGPKMSDNEQIGGCCLPRGLPPNIFAPTTKILPKRHFGGPFNAKPIVEKAVRKLQVNGVTKLKLYSYIVIDSVCKNYSARGVRGRRAL